MEHRQRSGEVSQMSWRKGKGDGVMRDQGAPRGGQYFYVQDRGERHLSQGPGGA